ncbi:MAG: NAD(P)-dependent oxidoreductase [Nitrospirae bacterium]|nr:NAD(P)-dependent oxidoreductase [Nitrospirota bacterium]
MTSNAPQESALVTGASGFVGSHLVDALVDAGWAVTATCRRRPSYLSRQKYAGVRYVAGDLNTSDGLGDAAAGQGTVFHAGALFDFFASRKDLETTNVEGTRRLVETARRAGAKKFLYISSGAIYGTGYENRLVAEKDPPLPTDKYAQTKWAGEQVVFEANGKDGLAVLSVRPGAIYGPGSRYGDAKALYLLKRGLLFGKPGLREMISSHVHVHDVARASLHLARHEACWQPAARDLHEVAYNLCDNSPTFNGALLERASALMPEKGLLGFFNVRIPAWILKLSAHAVETGARLIRKRPWFEVDSIDYITCGHGLSNEKLKATGYTFEYPSILDALEDVIRWYESTGWAVFESDGTVWNEA